MYKFHRKVYKWSYKGYLDISRDKIFCLAPRIEPVTFPVISFSLDITYLNVILVSKIDQFVPIGSQNSGGPSRDL